MQMHAYTDSKTLLHTSRIHNIEYFYKNLYNTQIDLENMQELRTYLVHYQTGSWRYTEYNWPKLKKNHPIKK